ncbi:hypothetical protein Ancab_031951 [Ancistrocladus abbreviatus]
MFRLTTIILPILISISLLLPPPLFAQKLPPHLPKQQKPELPKLPMPNPIPIPNPTHIPIVPPHNNVIKPAFPIRRHRGRKSLPPGAGLEFLTTHNKIRAKFGEPPLVWSHRLAGYAHRHGSKLAINCSSLIHSGGPFGENLFWALRDHWTPEQIVESWANEGKFYDIKTKVCSLGNKKCGHFTQIVWSDTRMVGCQRLKCGRQGIIGICSYDPPGNFLNESPFETAKKKLSAVAVATKAARKLAGLPFKVRKPGL